MGDIFGSSDQTVTQTNIPAWAEPFLQEVSGWARDESMRDAPIYGQPRVANLTPDELAGITAVRSLSVPFQIGDASNRASYAMDYALGTANNFSPSTFTAPRTSTGRFTGDEAAFYMSPYADAVTGIAANTAQRNADIQTAKRGVEASRAGAYGGYRHGIQQAEAEKNTAGLVNDIWTKGRQDAFLNAQQQFERDRQADLATQFANQQADLEAMRLGEMSKQFGANLGLNAANVGLGAAGTLGSLGQLENAIQLGNIDALIGAGGMQRDVKNQLLDIDYQDWLQEQGWERDQITWLNNILRGQIGAETTTTQPGPNTASQVVGTGLNIAALAKLFGFI